MDMCLDFWIRLTDIPGKAILIDDKHFTIIAVYDLDKNKLVIYEYKIKTDQWRIRLICDTYFDNKRIMSFDHSKQLIYIYCRQNCFELDLQTQKTVKSAMGHNNYWPSGNPQIIYVNNELHMMDGWFRTPLHS
eukprot:373256_1